MYLKKLEIVGFKSFYNKTILHFEPGITAIVGPNGCGKSNIFDSIRWVLGEQSVKSLRGSEMQDVIFNGTDTKEALSMAEVTLVFDNLKRYFAIDQDEVAITRRLFRSGESEYLLNKSVVRLKDILDLLMGTGIGAESYSLVEQGKIDLVLSSRPEDRRLVFDEASGITKYKAQKREALRKMSETEQNLLRVNDIIVEVKRQISSLERQANKARRYKEVFEELKTKEIELAFLKKRQLLDAKDEIIRQLRELESKETQLLGLIQVEESRISNRQAELKALEDRIMALRNEILSLDNGLVRDKEHIVFNREKIAELKNSKIHLEGQSEQVRLRLSQDEEKLSNVRQEYEGIKKNVDDKTGLLRQKETLLNNLNSAVKEALTNISGAKRDIMELVSRIAVARNDAADAASKQQIYLARQKRLELEQAKVGEEKASTNENLNAIAGELDTLNKNFQQLSLEASNLKKQLEEEGLALGNIKSEIEELEKQLLSLGSQKEFLEKLKTRYEDISETMNAVIRLDRPLTEEVNGLVVKIKSEEEAGLKLLGEAKPMDLDTQKITLAIQAIEEKNSLLKNNKEELEAQITGLNEAFIALGENIRSQEINLANKRALHNAVIEQANKLAEEEEIINIELSDVKHESENLSAQICEFSSRLSELDNQHKTLDSLIVDEENNIGANTLLKEEALIAITQAKTELEGLTKRISSEESTVRILEDSYKQDKEGLLNFESQIKEAHQKQAALEEEIKDMEKRNAQSLIDIEERNSLLKDEEEKYKGISSSAVEYIQRIELQRKELDSLKNKLYELQMQDKDVDFKYQSIKERIIQVYKVDLEIALDKEQPKDEGVLSEEIAKLKEKIDSYGTVNLVAIEEYDELKKRYDFLTQQHADLLSAKDQLHEAILKINRTTKKMFLETFERVRLEFRNYFRLLFNGGDCQLFLIDEQDPLESGIEIIARPPGKKLQNVLLLSGGEKSLSAIALIFAIFKVRPSPFCVLDEIDAALDEANVDRFGRILQEFIATSQFLVITHNKKTIINADVMYGITMEQSGISKIVSVRFAQGRALKDKETDLAVV